MYTNCMFLIVGKRNDSEAIKIIINTFNDMMGIIKKEQGIEVSDDYLHKKILYFDTCRPIYICVSTESEIKRGKQRAVVTVNDQ